MTARRPSTIVFAIAGPVDRGDVPGFCERMRALLEESGANVAVCDVGAIEADAVAVDALARLQLAARQLGLEIRLRHASTELRQLIEFVGLADVLPVEAGGQAEEREQRLGIQEERELGDPSG